MDTYGMVVKIKCKTCIVLTMDGEYREVPLPAGEGPRLGQEIKFSDRKRLPYLKQMIAAASLFIVIMAGMLLSGETPPASAYLTIDINPSIELAVAATGKVISARAIDGEGERILSEVKVKGQDLPEAVRTIVTQAVADRYIVESGDNVILATITVDDGREPTVDLNSVYEAIKQPVESNGLATDVIIEPVDPELRREAIASGISTGRYLLFHESGKKGLPISINDITSMSLGNLEKEKKVNLVDLIAGDDRGDLDAPQESSTKTLRRGIYVEHQSPAGERDKLVEKPVQEKNREESNADMQDQGDKVSKDVKNAKNDGNENKGQGKNKSGNELYKRDNDKRKR